MASNTFELVGRLAMGKESEKFTPFEKSLGKNNPNWENVSLKFTVIAGDNRHFLDIRGGHMKDGTGKIYAFTKTGKDNEGRKVKGESIQVAWADRFKPEILEDIAEFKKFILDLEEPKRRFELEKAVEKFKDGSITDEELTQLGIDNPIKALEDSRKKRKEYIAESDYAEILYKLISSGKYTDRLFTIKGNIEYTEYKGEFYKHMIPTRIYLAEKDAIPSSLGQMTVFFNENCVDTSSFKDENKIYINTYTRNYDSKRKEDIPCPVQLVLDCTKNDTDSKIKGFNNLIQKQFESAKDGKWKTIGVKVKLLNGSQKMELTDDMLNDFQREMLELGATTKEEIIRENGGDIYGNKIEETVIINVARGFTKGSQDTIYTDQDFVLKEIEEDKRSNEATKENDEEDIFAGIDDDLGI